MENEKPSSDPGSDEEVWSRGNFGLDDDDDDEDDVVVVLMVGAGPWAGFEAPGAQLSMAVA